MSYVWDARPVPALDVDPDLVTPSPETLESSFCFVVHSDEVEVILGRRFGRPGLCLKVMKEPVEPWRGRSLAQYCLWGNVPLVETIRVQNLFARHGFAPRVYAVVALNGERIASMDMGLWTSAKNNPDGSEIPPWLNKPLAKHPTKGRIGVQGKHAGAPVWFRNIKIRELKQ